MKSYDVYMESFVNVLIPDNVDPDSNDGAKVIYELATAKYLALLHEQPPKYDLNWEHYPDGDTDETQENL